MLKGYLITSLRSTITGCGQTMVKENKPNRKTAERQVMPAEEWCS